MIKYCTACLRPVHIPYLGFAYDRYTPAHMLVASIALTFALAPPEYAAAVWVGGLIIYYSLTSGNKPEHTGGFK